MEGIGSGGDDGKGDKEWWKEFEEKKTDEKRKPKDKWPAFETPTLLFSLRNQNATFIRCGFKKPLAYAGKYLSRLKVLIAAYDIQFKNGDQYLENSNSTVEQLRRTPIGKLALARDELLAFLWSIYQDDKEEWIYLQNTGFLVVMIQVAQGGTCNNELAKQLRNCLGI